jgi:uncharacterized protein (TIGR02284 family)
MLTRRGEKPQDLLNHLLAACIDDRFALLDAADTLPGTDQRAELRERAHSRTAFEHELATHIGELGGTPTHHGSLRPRAGAFLHHVTRTLVGGTEGDVYRTLAATEARSETAYARVLQHALPSAVRDTVEHQHTAIALDQQHFRRRQWAGPERTR